MYIPSHFAQHDLTTLHDAIARYSFATLVSGAAGQLFASHLPLLLDSSAGEQGTLLGHMARANSQWKSAAGLEVLAIFSGPHAYISPQWYEAEQVVPTWNYVAVHAYGKLEWIDDKAEVCRLLNRTVETYEASQTNPWRMNESPEFVARLVKQIVAFRIPISRLEGKWKLNQNRPAEQREKVIERLNQQGDESAKGIANLMKGFRF